MNESARDAPDLEVATQKSRAEVQGWLAGDLSPHGGDLRSIARLLGRSPYFFMLPEPPATTPTAVRFRRALSPSISEEERALELEALRWGQRTQRVTRKLLVEGSSGLDGADVSEQDDPIRAAASARDWLGWESQAQVRATSKSAAFKVLRAAVEERGVVVILRSTGTSRFCGYSLPDSEAPLIYINKDYGLASVRSFTLLHELGHIFHDTRRVCYGGDKGVERWCNRFAAAFLMPRQHLVDYWESQGLQVSSPQDTDPVRRVANRYKTSWHASAIRLEELGLAPLGTADFVKNTRPEPRESGFSPSGGRRTPAIRYEEFGRTFSRLVTDAAGRGTIASLDARRLLRVNGKQLADLAELAQGGAS